jgi:hypothetical protein
MKKSVKKSSKRRVHYFSKHRLIEENRKAIKADRNRTLVPELLEELPFLNFPVVQVWDHDGREARLEVLIWDKDGQSHYVFLDVPYPTVKTLPYRLVPLAA